MGQRGSQRSTQTSVQTPTISSFQFDNSTSFYGASSTPMYIFAGESKEADIAWVPGDTNAEEAGLVLVINDPDFVDPIPLLGNSCENSVLSDWDEDDDGWQLNTCTNDGGTTTTETSRRTTTPMMSKETMIEIATTVATRATTATPLENGFSIDVSGITVSFGDLRKTGNVELNSINSINDTYI